MEKRTLLLTPWFLPVGILHWQDAVSMMYTGKASVVISYEETVCSPSVELDLPAVIKYNRYKSRKYKNGAEFNRANVYARDHHMCQYCGTKFSYRELTYDHVVPKSAGGEKNWENIVASCKGCNHKKKNLTCDQSGMFPLNMPYQPKAHTIKRILAYQDNSPSEWESFIDKNGRIVMAA